MSWSAVSSRLSSTVTGNARGAWPVVVVAVARFAVSAATADPSTVRMHPVASTAAQVAVKAACENRRIAYCLAALAAIWEAISTADPPAWL